MRLNTKLLRTYILVGTILLLAVGAYGVSALRQDALDRLRTVSMAQLYQFDIALDEFFANVEYDVLNLTMNRVQGGRLNPAYTL